MNEFAILHIDNNDTKFQKSLVLFKNKIILLLLFYCAFIYLDASLLDFILSLWNIFEHLVQVSLFSNVTFADF